MSKEEKRKVVPKNFVIRTDEGSVDLTKVDLETLGWLTVNLRGIQKFRADVEFARRVQYGGKKE